MESSKHDKNKDKDIKTLWSDPTSTFSYTSGDAFYRGLRELKEHDTPKYIAVLKKLEQIPSYVMHLRRRTGYPTRHVDYKGMGMGHQFMIDLGEMPKTGEGYKYFILLVDQFDGFIYTAGMKTKTGEEFRQKFGKIRNDNNLTEMDVLAADSGQEFVSSRAYFKSLHVKLILKGNRNKAFAVCLYIPRTLLYETDL